MSLNRDLGVVSLMLLQLRASRMFSCSLVFLLASMLGSRAGLSYADQVFLAVLGVTVSMVLLAATTSIHEALHFRKALELGVEVREVRILGLGSIAYRVEVGCPGKALVAEAPYRTPHQYIAATLWLGLIIAPIPFIPILPRMVFAMLSLLPLMLLASTLCTLRAFKGPEGFCYRLASRLGSHSDIAEAHECCHQSHKSLSMRRRA